MVEMLPFRGLRYTAPFSMPSVFAPPYDVVSTSTREKLTRHDAHNIAHIDVTPANASPEWYSAAAAQFRTWQEQQVLALDSELAYYAYVQEFTMGGITHTRRGLFCRARLAEWGQGIYRHEHTRAAPRADRLNLMWATRAQLSPVFGMISDPALQLASWLYLPAEAPIDFIDQESTRQIFWPITDPTTVAAIRDFLAPKEIVIADGHHRYETALAYRDECHKAGPATAEPQEYDYVLMYITAVEDPGLVILPTHRLITNTSLPETSALLAGLKERFEVTPVTGDESLEQAILPFAASHTAFGLCLGHASRWVIKRPRALPVEGSQTGAPDVSSLDVSVLQEMILEPLLNITPAALSQGEQVTYTVSEAEACSRVDNGTAQAAFILNPTHLNQVWDAACALQTMPQKSTYFYPKLLTGLVIHLL